MNTNHRHTRSLKTVPSPNNYSKSILGVKNRIKSNSTVKLPTLRKNATSVGSSRVDTIGTGENIEEVNFQREEFLRNFREKCSFIKTLKYRIIQFQDNVLNKKVLSELNYLNESKILLEIWANIQVYEFCRKQNIERLEQKLQVKMSQQIIKTLSYLANVISFLLAEYKQKRWNLKQSIVQKQLKYNNTSKQKIRLKTENVQSVQTKLALITSLSQISHDCYWKKEQYVNWREKAVKKLNEKQIKCQLLRAQMFTESLK